MITRRFTFLLYTALALALALPAIAQSTAGPFTLNAANQCASISTSGQSTVGLSVSGTFSMTLQPEVAIHGQTAVNSQVTPAATTTAQGTITASGAYRAAVGGYDTFLVCVSAYTSGSVTIYLNATRAINAGLFGGSGSSPLVQDIVRTGLLAEYRFNEGSGTTLTDYSGSGNNGTFCASGPVWNGANPTNSGLTFNGAIFNCVNLPAALNTARTVILVTNFIPPNTATFQTPVCGNTATDWGGMFKGAQLGQTAGTQGGEYILAGWGQSTPGLFPINTVQSAHGVQMIAWTLGSASDSTTDQIWVANNFYPFGPLQPPLIANAAFGSAGQSAGKQSAGNYVLGGGAAGTCMTSFSSWWTGAMYSALFYSGYLTQAQIGIDFTVLASSLAQRGINLSFTNLQQTGGNAAFNLNNQYVATGDSITYGTGLTTAFPQYIAFPSAANSWNWIDIGLPSGQAVQATNDNVAETMASWLQPGSAQNVATFWLGTNDCTAGATGVQAYANNVNAIRDAKTHTIPTQKLIVLSMISRTGQDTCKNALNTPMRQTWATFADGFADIAADPNLGADGASANTTFFQGDAIHPTTHAQANDIAPIVQRAIRRIFGNTSWTAATTYTTAATAAVATTAGSESVNTITITFGATPANCQVGNQITIAGTTPAGYSGTWQILTRSATQVTYWTNTTGLGAITVQGTGVCPQQQDEDVYTILGGSAAGNPSFTLESCQGYTGQNLYLKNSNTTSAWVITPFGTETIDGATSLTMPTASSGNNPVVVLQSTLVSAAAGGCTWKRLQ